MSEELDDLVAHGTYGDVQETLQFFFEECALDEAPTVVQVAHWQAVLQTRGGKFLKLAAMCQTYLDEYETHNFAEK